MKQLALLSLLCVSMQSIAMVEANINYIKKVSPSYRNFLAQEILGRAQLQNTFINPAIVTPLCEGIPKELQNAIREHNRQYGK